MSKKESIKIVALSSILIGASLFTLSTINNKDEVENKKVSESGNTDLDTDYYKFNQDEISFDYLTTGDKIDFISTQKKENRERLQKEELERIAEVERRAEEKRLAEEEAERIRLAKIEEERQLEEERLKQLALEKKKKEELIKQQQEIDNSKSPELIAERDERREEKVDNTETPIVSRGSDYMGQAQTYRASAYTPYCDGCSGITKTGHNLRESIYQNGRRVVAVDPNRIPLGSIMQITLLDGTTFEAVASDIGGAIKNDRIDISYNTKDEAYRFGRQDVTVRMIQRGGN